MEGVGVVVGEGGVIPEDYTKYCLEVLVGEERGGVIWDAPEAGCDGLSLYLVGTEKLCCWFCRAIGLRVLSCACWCFH